MLAALLCKRVRPAPAAATAALGRPDDDDEGWRERANAVRARRDDKDLIEIAMAFLRTREKDTWEH